MQIDRVVVGYLQKAIQSMSLFFKLLYDESLEEVQIACVRIIGRILVHGYGETLIKTRSECIQCVEFLLLNKKKMIREAFCSQISSFVKDHVLSCLFLDSDSSNKATGKKFLGILKHSLLVADDPQTFETLLESLAQIMIAVDIRTQIFLSSLILLVDQLDNPHMTVRMNASRIIRKSCFFHVKGGFDQILSKLGHIRNEVFDYLTTSLATRPTMVREFTEAVLGVETEKLIEKMIPIVLPKLVVSHRDNGQAVHTLLELAKCMNTDMVPLIVNRLPKVLAFALHHDHTGSDNQEIFSAALPALLDELVCVHLR